MLFQGEQVSTFCTIIYSIFTFFTMENKKNMPFAVFLSCPYSWYETAVLI